MILEKFINKSFLLGDMLFEFVHGHSQVCRLRRDHEDQDIELKSVPELVFHLPHGVRSQMHNLQHLLETLDFGLILIQSGFMCFLKVASRFKV